MDPKIELTSVTQALAVAEHLSFRRAAGALGVCQSSVSKRVIKLENVLGVDLFDRHHTGADRHPEVEVNIVEGGPRENLMRLRAEQLDILRHGRACCA